MNNINLRQYFAPSEMGQNLALMYSSKPPTLFFENYSDFNYRMEFFAGLALIYVVNDRFSYRSLLPTRNVKFLSDYSCSNTQL